MLEAIGAVTDRCTGILLERRAYEEFEGVWSTRTDGDPGTAFFNDTRKDVVSSTLAESTRRNFEAIGPYDPERIRRLKATWYVASSTLVRAMLAAGLVDQFRLPVFPSPSGEARDCSPKAPTPAPLSWPTAPHRSRRCVPDLSTGGLAAPVHVTWVAHDGRQPARPGSSSGP